MRHNFWEIWRWVRANLPLLRGGYCVTFLLANLLFRTPSPPLLIIIAQSLIIGLHSGCHENLGPERTLNSSQFLLPLWSRTMFVGNSQNGVSLLAAGFFSKGHCDARALRSVKRTQKSGMAVWSSREEGETRKYHVSSHSPLAKIIPAEIPKEKLTDC